MSDPNQLVPPTEGGGLSASDYQLVQELVKQALSQLGGLSFTDPSGSHVRPSPSQGISARVVVVDKDANTDIESESIWVRNVIKNPGTWDGRWKTSGEVYEVLCWPTALQFDYHEVKEEDGFLSEESQPQRLIIYASGDAILDPVMTKNGLMALNFNSRIRASDCQVARD